MKTLTARDKALIKRNLAQDDLSKVEWKLIESLSPEERNQAEKQAIEIVARTHRLSIDQVTPSPIGRANLTGGELSKIFKRICLRTIEGKIEEYKDDLHKSICIDFNYCQKRRTKELESEEYSLALAICDGIVIAATGIPIPITWLSIYIVKSRLLDGWCDCE